MLDFEPQSRMKIKCLTPRAKALGVKQLIFILDFGSKSNIDLMVQGLILQI